MSKLVKKKKTGEFCFYFCFLLVTTLFAPEQIQLISHFRPRKNALPNCIVCASVDIEHNGRFSPFTWTLMFVVRRAPLGLLGETLDGSACFLLCSYLIM